MSYNNKPLYVPTINAFQLISNDIITKYLHQHTTMVDMLMYQEVSRNGWSIYATPFYLTNNNEEMNPLMSNAEKDNEEVEGIGKKNTTGLEKQNLIIII